MKIANIKLLSFITAILLCFSFGCRDKNSVCVTFKQKEIQSGAIAEKVIAKKWIKKGETLATFPILTKAENDFLGYRLVWLKDNRVEASFENITSDMTVWAYFFEYAKTPLVSYAQTTPTIDGEIDEAWKRAPKFKAEYGYDAKFENQATGYASLMWSEEGIYFLGVIKDETLCAQDHCCFWVGENFYNERWYVTDISNGNYQACSNYLGENAYQQGSAIGKEGVRISGRTTSDGYIVETFIPRQSNGEGKDRFSAGDFIGFDFSINDYHENKVERVHRCSWYHDIPTDSLGAYQNEGYLYKVQLAEK